MTPGDLSFAAKTLRDEADLLRGVAGRLDRKRTAVVAAEHRRDADRLGAVADLLDVLARGDVPRPAPPGSGEVAAADPHQAAVRSLANVPPLRDNGGG